MSLSQLPSLAARTKRFVGKRVPPAIRSLLVGRKVQRALSDLESQGIAVVPDFFSPAKCRRCVRAMDEYLSHPDAAIHRKATGDQRIFAAEYIDEEIRAFKHSPFCKTIAVQYSGIDQRCLFTMANRLERSGPALCRSGGRWHRDRKKKQFKALVYLVDVPLEAGPFSIFPRSGVQQAGYDTELSGTGLDFSQVRWDDEDFAPFFAAARPRLRVLTARAGTLVLFDSSLIHSGQPMEKGVRYALTNYYYGPEMPPQRAQEKWHPTAGPIDRSA